MPTFSRMDQDFHPESAESMDANGSNQEVNSADGSAAPTTRGLTTVEAQGRLLQHGPNLLPESRRKTIWSRFFDQFRSALIYILLVALIIDVVVWYIEAHQSWPFESIAIGVILLLNAGLGVYQESKAEQALARLKALAKSHVWVMRDGKITHLPATELVPGDLVRIESGDRVPADGTLTEAQGLMVDESVLTGESMPVEKEIGHEVFSGTLLSRGKGYLEITRTGALSAAGKLALMIGSIEAQKTPLERRLADFGGRVGKWILALTVLLAVGGILVEGISRVGHVLVFAVALAVAAVPEGLPAVLTLTLALGVERMAKKMAVVRRLSAVEALGSVTVIATDKTGTLTENRMQVKQVDSLNSALALRAMALVNDAEHEVGAGDPLELALLEHVASREVDVPALVQSSPRFSVLPFDSSYKFMRVTVQEEGGLVSYVKGAAEVLLQRCQLAADERVTWEGKAEAYATEGFRVLALAWRTGEGETDLSFIGLVLLWDPPRAEVPEAIRLARAAGIRVVMVTGDHPATALAVANEVGIAPGRIVTGPDLLTLSPAELTQAVKEANIFARVAPQDKLRLVEALQESGEIVAVTGDGVNDAPALKRSDVGVAMGRRGSDVSREVADLVLLDDNFATIVSAIKQGRNIYENIQKFIRFLFSANLALTLIVVLGAFGAFLLNLRDSVGGLLLPLTAMQLLWINVITNGPPALALGLDRNQRLMRQRPRDPRSPLLDRPSLRFVLVAGTFSALIGGLLLIDLPRVGYSMEVSRTLLFLYATISQLVLVYPARRLIGAPRTNMVLHLTVVVCIALQLLALMVPGLRLVLGLQLPDPVGLVWVAAAVVVSLIVADVASRLIMAKSEKEPSLDVASQMPRFFERLVAAGDIRFLRRILIAVAGMTVLLIGVALLVLPGPGLLLIGIGLAILATEFAWAKVLFTRAQTIIARKNRSLVRPEIDGSN